MIDYSFNSNTSGASANQFFFNLKENEIQTSRVLYKISKGGRFNYSFLFTNITDSTYSDGSESVCNEPYGEWVIHSASVACVAGRAFKGLDGRFACEVGNIDCDKAIYFGGLREKRVKSGEIFKSDEALFEFNDGDYLCLEISFSGRRIPCHTESILPIFKLDCIDWKYCTDMPLPACIGCDMSVKARVAFLGDSITQGIGTKVNSYAHWSALLAERLGFDYAYWNLGIGYGRADDLYQNGIWLEKAAMNDIIFVCLGVNDLLQGYSAEGIKNSLYFIAKALKESGKRVIFQTLPPFDYVGSQIVSWQSVNEFIKCEIAKTVDFVFDCVPLLSVEGESHRAKFGGHPNEAGCALWADALYSALVESAVFG